MEENIIEKLEQYNFSESDYISKNEYKYSYWIGLFLIRFSELEHEINNSIADLLFDDSHELGYTVIENISIRNKLNLLNKLLLQRIYYTTKENKKVEFKKIIKDIDNTIIFRNNIAHADWHATKKGGLVRIKIITDKEDGFVKFKNIKIQPRNIKAQITVIDRLIEDLNNFILIKIN